MTSVGWCFSKIALVASKFLISQHSDHQGKYRSNSPQVAIFTAQEHPVLTLLLAETTASRLILDDVLDGLADKTGTASDKDG